MSKNLLIEHCLGLVSAKEGELTIQLEILNDAIANETKSSAGDKFETSREMMHQEKAKISDQLRLQKVFRMQLNAVRKEPAKRVEFGALIITNNGNFFVAAALGKIEFEKNSYFIISEEAPFYKMMHHKEAGEEFEFRKKVYSISDVS